MGIRDKMTGPTKDEIISRLLDKGLNPEIAELLNDDDEAFKILLKFQPGKSLTEALNALYEYLINYRNE
jgi:hypothetical protein